MSLQLLNGLRYIKFLLGCDSLVADIVVLIDESNRVRSVMYKLQKDFVNQVLNQLPVSKNMTHVGIIRFSDFNRTKVVSPLGNVTVWVCECWCCAPREDGPTVQSQSAALC